MTVSGTPLASTHSENSTESTSSTNPETDPPRRSFHQTVKDLFVPILVPTAVFVFAFALAITMWLACKGKHLCLHEPKLQLQRVYQIYAYGPQR